MIATTPQIWLLFVAWIGIGYWAGKSHSYAWGRIWLVMSISSFALPLASIIMGANVTAQEAGAATDAASEASAVIGGALGTTALAAFTGFIGLFLGIIFGIMAYFSLRAARQSNTTV